MVMVGCGNRMAPMMKAFQASLVVNSPAWTGRSTSLFMPQSDASSDESFLMKVAQAKTNELARASAHHLASLLERTGDKWVVEACDVLNKARISMAQLIIVRETVSRTVITKKKVNVVVEHMVDMGEVNSAVDKASTAVAQMQAWYSLHIERGERLGLEKIMANMPLLPKVMRSGLDLFRENITLLLSVLRAAAQRLTKNLKDAIPDWQCIDPGKDYSQAKRFLPWLKANVVLNETVLALPTMIEATRSALKATTVVYEKANTRLPTGLQEEADDIVKKAQLALCVASVASFVYLTKPENVGEGNDQKVRTGYTIPVYNYILHVLGGLGLGARGFDGPSAFRSRPQPRSPSIRKRCACGFPQGTAEPLRHASNNVLLSVLDVLCVCAVEQGFPLTPVPIWEPLSW